MQFKFTVRGDRITRENENSFVEGNQNSYTAVFDFGNDASWDNVAKLCVIKTDSGEVYRLPIFENACTLPVFEKGRFEIGVMGALTYDGEAIEGEEGVVISTNMYRCEAINGAATKEANAELNNAAQVWMKYLSDMEEKRQAAAGSAEEAKESADAAEKSALKISDMTVSAESLPEGEVATVTKTEDKDTLHLVFGIPKGEKGPKGDKGDRGEKGETGADGKTPVKGKDYFTSADIEEFNNTPKERVNFTNGIRFEAREDGLYVVFDDDLDVQFVRGNQVLATESDYAYMAENDINGRAIVDTYARKEELQEHFQKDFASIVERTDSLEQSVEILAVLTDEETTPFATKEYIQSYVEEAILGGVW